MDVVVVGGGVIGSAVGYFLARAGHAVTVLERDELGGQASSAAAGILAPTVEGDRGGPFFELMLASRRLFPELAEQLRAEAGVEIDYAAPGLLSVAFDEAEERALRAGIAWQAQRGLDVRWLEAGEVQRLEPQLSPEVRGALYSGEGHQVSSARLVQGFVQAGSRLGARFVGGTPVLGLERQGDEVRGVRLADRSVPADAVVLACGAWSALCGEWLGRSVPVTPVKGQILALQAIPGAIRRIVYRHSAYLVPRRDGTVVLGATEERVGFDRRVTVAGLRTLLGAVPALAPALADAQLRGAWAGLRPGTPDGLPILGPVPGLRGAYLATGHYRNGVLLAPITGRLCVDWLAGSAPALPLDPFRVERFWKR